MTPMTRRPTAAETYQIYRLGSDHPDFTAAIRLVMTGLLAPSANGAVAESRINDLVRDPRHRVMLVAAYDQARIISAAIVVGSLGGAGLVYLPVGPLMGEMSVALESILAHLISWPENSEITLFQALISPADRERASILKAAGFRFLAELIYLERSVDQDDPPVNLSPSVSWRTFHEREREVFVQALAQTYRDSLDCPGLSGIRPPAQALESHKATGIYDPAGWFLATCDNRVAGLVFTSQVNHRAALEVTYMGVSPPFRGKGVGNALLQKAFALARDRGLSHVTLAVDSINQPARMLYDRWGFREIARMRAWIAKTQSGA